LQFYAYFVAASNCARSRSPQHEHTKHRKTLADPKILNSGGWGEGNVSASSSFVANAHNELYAFYTENGSFLEKKNSEPIGGAPLNPPLLGEFNFVRRPRAGL